MPKTEMNTLVVGTKEYEIVDATARSSVSNKMQLVSNPTSDNLLAVNSGGQAIDSGKKLSDLQNKLTAGRNIRFNGDTIIGTNNAIHFSSGTLLDTLIANDDCTDFFKVANSWSCEDFPDGYKTREGAITLVRQRDTTYEIRRGSVELTIFGLDNMTFKRRIYNNAWAGDWQYYRAKLNTFATKTFTTTAATTTQGTTYAWSIDAKLDGYKVANFTVMPSYSGARMTNAEYITSSDVISGYSSQAGTSVRVLVFYVASDYITLL